MTTNQTTRQNLLAQISLLASSSETLSTEDPRSYPDFSAVGLTAMPKKSKRSQKSSLLPQTHCNSKPPLLPPNPAQWCRSFEKGLLKPIKSLKWARSSISRKQLKEDWPHSIKPKPSNSVAVVGLWYWTSWRPLVRGSLSQRSVGSWERSKKDQVLWVVIWTPSMITPWFILRMMIYIKKFPNTRAHLAQTMTKMPIQN